MMALEDYKIIEELIDEIIGIDTKQGSNLVDAIKNYFESKPLEVKLVKEISGNKSFQKHYSTAYDNDAKLAMENYTKKLQSKMNKLKEKGQFCGISS
jgi:hypothetical protein